MYYSGIQRIRNAFIVIIIIITVSAMLSAVNCAAVFQTNASHQEERA